MHYVNPSYSIQYAIALIVHCQNCLHRYLKLDQICFRVNNIFFGDEIAAKSESKTKNFSKWFLKSYPVRRNQGR
jgi:hypothetical protein